MWTRITLLLAAFVLAVMLGAPPARATECANAVGGTAPVTDPSDGGASSNTACGDNSSAGGVNVVNSSAYGIDSTASGTGSSAFGNGSSGPAVRRSDHET